MHPHMSLQDCLACLEACLKAPATLCSCISDEIASQPPPLIEHLSLTPTLKFSKKKYKLRMADFQPCINATDKTLCKIAQCLRYTRVNKGDYQRFRIVWN
jgi:hypothetical protein